ncbi:MAG: molybdopterin-dependent oxidoreductase [bacterium]|nr:molybdopterin-dependent oxidoreductase [bacterium]
MAVETKITFCRVCEATCGLEVDVEVDENRVVDIRPDPKHVVSKGYACVKGTRWGATQHSPDRVLHPMKRTGDRWEEISWDQAIREIADRIRTQIDRHGPETFAHFVGSAGGAILMSPMFRTALYEGLGTRRMYGTGTCDTMNKFRVNGEMYGAPMRLMYPDVERASFMMVLGGNPAISGNTLYHLPRAQERFAEITRRGGRVVFVNPRRIETARAGEHLFIRPDTDVYFLAAFANELIRGGHVDRERVEAHMTGFETLARSVGPWTAERQAEVTGVPAETLRDLVRAHAEASRRSEDGQGGAALYMATGVNQGRSGSPCFWLLEAINAISGNLDRRGGTLLGSGLIDMGEAMGELGLTFDREDGLPTVSGIQPSGMLADDILNDAPGRVTAMIVEASNPLLACSNPNGRLDEAFASLDLLVTIDLFRNEVGSMADYVLPAQTWMERPEMPYALQSFAGTCPTPYIIYADPVLEAPPDVRPEWWIYVRLADELGVDLFGKKLLSTLAKTYAKALYSPLRRILPGIERLMDGMLKGAGMPGIAAMRRDHPHGLLLPENEGDNFLGTDRVLTRDKKVALAPTPVVEAFEENTERFYAEELANRDRLKLIGLRQIKRMNTASSNSEALVRESTNYAYLNPEDASRIGVSNGDDVDVRSDHGRIRIPVRVSDEMMPRTVAIPQCWGHAKADGLSHAAKHPGVNSNLLAGDGLEHVEALSGMSHLSGILIDVTRAS